MESKTAQKHSVTIDYFSQAIALDPNYALAYVGLADAYAADNIDFSREKLLKAREAAERALELDDGLSEAHFMHLPTIGMPSSLDILADLKRL